MPQVTLPSVDWCLLIAVLYYLACMLLLGVLGCLRAYRLQACIANVFIIVPSNILWAVSFVVLTPLRWLWIRFMNWLVTKFVSLFTVQPSFKDATFEKLLKAFPIGYGGILGVDIMDINEEEARSRMRQRITEWPFPWFRRSVGKCFSSRLLNSFTFRLIVATTVFPLLSWWLIGFTYIPFVPVFCRPTEGETTKDKRVTHSVDRKRDGSDVCLEIPDCTFLSRARKVYDDIDLGNRACVNE